MFISLLVVDDDDDDDDSQIQQSLRTAVPSFTVSVSCNGAVLQFCSEEGGEGGEEGK